MEKNTPHLVKAHSALCASPSCTKVLEIASGFLDHSIAYARQHPDVQFWPTECNVYLVSKLEEARLRAHLKNIQPATKLDALAGMYGFFDRLKRIDQLPAETDWKALRGIAAAPFDLVTVTNLLNVSPWQVGGPCRRVVLTFTNRRVTEALFEQIGRREGSILHREHGRLALYCCLKVEGRFQSEADEKFDAVLRARKSEFGIRNLDDITRLAEAQGLQLLSKDAPGGGTNLFLVFGFER